ncbi:O-antigen ligase family protein [Flexivirga sp. B27]
MTDLGVRRQTADPVAPGPDPGGAADWRIWRFDASAVLSLYVWMFAFIPSVLVFAPLGAAGTPAQMLALLIFLWWGSERLRRGERAHRQGAVIRFALTLYALGMVVSYVAAATRPIATLEINSTDRSLISLTAWSGVLLLALDGIASRERLERLVHRIAVSGGAVGALGLIQFATKRQWIDLIQIPGLGFNSDLEAVSRSGFDRPAGTATHPIEFGVVIAMCLPIAIHDAMHGRPGRSLLRRWWPVAALAMACPVSISRTTIMCLVLSLPIVVAAWPPARRRLMYLMTLVVLAVFYELVPGMLGTLAGMFTGISTDGSAKSRTDSYAYALEFIERWPVFGRGYGTFLPEYRILDNMVLGVLIGGGIVGLLLTVWFARGAFVTGIRVMRRSVCGSWSDSLARSLVAAVISAFASYATFDTLGFPMVPCLLFLVVGMLGALARIKAAESGSQTIDIDRHVARKQDEHDA